MVHSRHSNKCQFFPRASVGQYFKNSVDFFVVVVQSLSCLQLFVMPWTAACRASLSFTISRVCSNSCLLSWWCHPTISSSVAPSSKRIKKKKMKWAAPTSCALGQSLGTVRLRLQPLCCEGVISHTEWLVWCSGPQPRLQPRMQTVANTLNVWDFRQFQPLAAESALSLSHMEQKWAVFQSPAPTAEWMIAVVSSLCV